MENKELQQFLKFLPDDMDIVVYDEENDKWKILSGIFCTTLSEKAYAQIKKEEKKIINFTNEEICPHHYKGKVVILTTHIFDYEPFHKNKE